MNSGSKVEKDMYKDMDENILTRSSNKNDGNSARSKSFQQTHSNTVSSDCQDSQGNTEHVQNVPTFKLIKIIGKGTYSTVYLSERNKNSQSLIQTNIKAGEELKLAEEDDVVSQISEVLQGAQSVSLWDKAQIQNFAQSSENVESQALKLIQKPNFQKYDKSYNDQKLIFMNDAHVLQNIQGHPNIVELIEIIPEGVVQTSDQQKLHVDYAMAIECLRGGELSYNLKKFGRYPPNICKYFFKQVVDAIAYMHSKGFCHRDLKPWNIMLTDDLSNAKVIDFSYSTSLIPEQFEKSPDMLKGFLPGTKQFMAPEQFNTESFPIMDDFSKIDIWALAIFLINMLTLDFPFFSVNEKEDYSKFMKNPQQFFYDHQVKFQSLDELNMVCDLLKKMLEIDLTKRIGIAEVQQQQYIQGIFENHVSNQQVKDFMQARLVIDNTIKTQRAAQISKQDTSDQLIPKFIPFSWNTTILRHTFQAQMNLDQIIDSYKKYVRKLNFTEVEKEEGNSQQEIQANQFYISKQTDKTNIFIIHIGAESTLKDSNNNTDMMLMRPLEAHLVFQIDNSISPTAYVCEFLRRKGDYLSFISFYVYMWNQFNQAK